MRKPNETGKTGMLLALIAAANHQSEVLGRIEQLLHGHPVTVKGWKRRKAAADGAKTRRPGYRRGK